MKHIILFLYIFFATSSPSVLLAADTLPNNTVEKSLENLIKEFAKHYTSSSKTGKKDKYTCFSGDPTKYCKNLPKTKNKKPTKVQISVHLLDILEINQIEGTWTVRGFLYARWKDSRLRFKPKDFENLKILSFNGKLAENQLQRIWVPNLTITNHISRREVEKKDVSIKRNGTVLYKEIFTAKIKTYFNYRKFPFDEHIATIEIEPFSDTKKFVSLVPAVRKSGNSSIPPDVWSTGKFKVEFSDRPGARQELSSDTPGAWLSPDGENNFSLMTVNLELERNYFNFLATKLAILFVLALIIWLKNLGWSSDKRSLDWPWEIFLGLVFFSHNAQDMLPTLPYLTLYNVLVIELYIYAFCDLAIWVFAARLVHHDNFDHQLLYKRLKFWLGGPMFLTAWALTTFWYINYV